MQLLTGVSCRPLLCFPKDNRITVVVFLYHVPAWTSHPRCVLGWQTSVGEDEVALTFNGHEGAVTIYKAFMVVVHSPGEHQTRWNRVGVTGKNQTVSLTLQRIPLH